MQKHITEVKNKKENSDNPPQMGGFIKNTSQKQPESSVGELCPIIRLEGSTCKIDIFWIQSTLKTI